MLSPQLNRSWGEFSGRAHQSEVAAPVCCRTDQLGMFTHKEFEQLAPVLDGFSLMTYDYSTAHQ